MSRTRRVQPCASAVPPPAWCSALRATSPPMECPTRTTSWTGTGQAVDQRAEQRVEGAAVLGDVQAGVVAQVDRRQPEVALQQAAVGDRRVAVVPLGAVAPGVLGLGQPVQEDGEPAGRVRGTPPRSAAGLDRHGPARRPARSCPSASAGRLALQQVAVGPVEDRQRHPAGAAGVEVAAAGPQGRRAPDGAGADAERQPRRRSRSGRRSRRARPGPAARPGRRRGRRGRRCPGAPRGSGRCRRAGSPAPAGPARRPRPPARRSPVRPCADPSRGRCPRRPRAGRWRPARRR